MKRINIVTCTAFSLLLILLSGNVIGQEKVIVKEVKSEDVNFAGKKMVDYYKFNGNNRMIWREKRMQRCREFLDLTDEQKEKMKAIKLETAQKLLPIKNEIKEKRARLHTLSTAEKANMKDINKVIDNITKLVGKQMKVNAACRQQMRSLLTDEQRIKFDTMKGKWKRGVTRMKAKAYGKARKFR